MREQNCAKGAYWANAGARDRRLKSKMLGSACETDVTLIHKLWSDYASALTAGDIELWISLWIQGGIKMSAAGRLLSGVEQIQAANRPLMDLFDTEMTILPEYIRIFDDCAYSYGYYKQVFTPKEGGESISFSGPFLTVFEKQACGSWKIAASCFTETSS